MANEKEPSDVSGKTFPQLTDYGQLEQFPEVANQKQGKNHRVFTRAPAAREVGDGEIVFSVVAGVKKIHTKLNGTLVSVVLT